MRAPTQGRVYPQVVPTMSNPIAPICTSMFVLLLTWSGAALAQASSIELLDVSTAVRIHHPASTQLVEPSAHESELRRASRAHDSVRERPHHQGHSQARGNHAGASAGLMCQSEVAEHRQERRGASAGKAGGSGKGNGPN